MLNIRQCKIGDIEEILELQDKVFLDLAENADLLRKNTRETFERCMKEPNFFVGLYDDAEMVGLGIMEDARGRDDDLGVVICRHSLSKGAYADCKLVMIRKPYYGRGLQRALMWIIEKNAYKRGYRYLITSVSPDNPYSRNNIIAMGYKYDTNKNMYGTLNRDVFIKELKIADYNQSIADFAESLEGREGRTEDVLEGIDLARCLTGTVEIASTGDAAQYYDPEMKGICYGRFVRDAEETRVLIRDEKTKTFAFLPFGTTLEKMELQKVWIDTVLYAPA